MSLSANTPESLRFARSDSKNPAATCKGITGNGRNCRRALAVGGEGIRRGGDGSGPEWFCHQHKDQAFAMTGRVGEAGRRKQDVIREKSSIETLVQRLGIQSGPEKKTKGSGRKDGRSEEKDFAVNDSETSNPGPRKETHPSRRRKQQRPGFWASLCCAGAPRDDDDYVEIIRHRRRMDPQTRPHSQGHSKTSTRPQPDRRASSNTATNNLLALLPAHLSPETTSSLLSELVKPISPADEEGFIYIYWLTKTDPGEDTARDLLAPPSKPTSRRISDVLATDHSQGTRPGTIMLKIGRASNVTRRMKEWERQCGFKLNLVRWYPYIGKDGSSSPATSPRREQEVHKVPFVKRVERLVHLELAGQQVRRQCAACGKEHREWFEVDATREGVRSVDAVVRRWVAWAQGKSMNT